VDKTVMIVDDELFYREVLRDLLIKEGFTVVAEATNCSEAVEKYQAHVPLITIMDIFMPGESGIDATREILSIDRNAKVLICSGIGFNEDVEASLNAGARDVIYKPFMPEEVITAVNKALA
jgi:two-component system, chemotaxis family, chemotaxis protein CheY